MIDVDYNEYKETLVENMKLIAENNRLKEVEKEHQKLNGELREEIERLKKREQECIDHYLVQCKYASEMEDKYITANNIINELEHDFERKIQSCTIGAETTTNDFYCRLHIATLTKWLNKIQELKGSDK